MSTLIVEVYDAFKELGVSEDKAIKAAEAISNVQTATKHDVEQVSKQVSELDKRVEVKLTLLHWMIGFNLAFTMVVLYKLLFV